MNWKWPSTKENNLNPWYVMVRRCVFFPLLVAGLCIMAVAASFGWGRGQAREVIKDIVG